MSPQQAEKGHRWHAALYDRLTKGDQRWLSERVRPRIIGEVRGRALEIGVGTGASFSHYSSEAEVVGTEPDPHMLKRARLRLEELGLSNIELHQAPAEDLPAEDASVDHVVTSLVLCTVSDLPLALSEARRVLKSDGTFRFVEHIRNDESRFWGAVQDVITPAWRWLGAGCNPNRRTRQAIEDAGFRIEWLEQQRIGPGTPAIYGVARPG